MLLLIDRQAEREVLKRVLHPANACFVSIFMIVCGITYDNSVSSHRSAIIFPEDKEVIIHTGKITMKGWAYSGGGNWVERVEVSPDGSVLKVIFGCNSD